MAEAVVSTRSLQVKLFHLTFYKCGSQWIRDVLADPRIAEYADHELAAGGIDLQSQQWPSLLRGQFASPLYSAGTGDWQRVSSASDRAFVVIRDPRDIVVSLVYSLSLSHTPSAITLLLRNPIADATPRNRIQIGMFLLAQWADCLRSWKNALDCPNAHIARYENLIVDLAEELRSLFAFLGWAVPDQIVERVARDNSFENRSGRKRGDENEFSHRRKGVAGDWRNHFDRELGQLFECTFPALLCELGYEQSNEWWRDLPDSLHRAEARAETQQERLLAVLGEHEKELATVRLAAEERLRDIGILHKVLHSLQNIAASAHFAAEARLRDIGILHVTLHSLQNTADQRLDVIEILEQQRIATEKSFSWRLGFRPLRAVGSLFTER